MKLTISRKGETRAIYSDALDFAQLGQVTTRRASHVEQPTPTAGYWLADLSPLGGPTLGPFAKRAEALAAEVTWIATNWRDAPDYARARFAEEID